MALTRLDRAPCWPVRGQALPSQVILVIRACPISRAISEEAGRICPGPVSKAGTALRRQTAIRRDTRLALDPAQIWLVWLAEIKTEHFQSCCIHCKPPLNATFVLKAWFESQKRFVWLLRLVFTVTMIFLPSWNWIVEISRPKPQCNSATMPQTVAQSCQTHYLLPKSFDHFDLWVN